MDVVFRQKFGFFLTIIFLQSYGFSLDGICSDDVILNVNVDQACTLIHVQSLFLHL